MSVLTLFVTLGFSDYMPPTPVEPGVAPAPGGDGVNEAEQRNVDPECVQWVKERLTLTGAFDRTAPMKESHLMPTYLNSDVKLFKILTLIFHRRVRERALEREPYRAGDAICRLCEADRLYRMVISSPAPHLSNCCIWNPT